MTLRGPDLYDFLWKELRPATNWNLKLWLALVNMLEDDSWH